MVASAPTSSFPPRIAPAHRRMIAPLNLLGYGLIVLIAANQIEPGRITDTGRYATCVVTLVLFFGGFLANTLLDSRGFWSKVAIAAQFLAALGNLYLIFDGFNPILLILIAAQLPDRTTPLRAAALMLCVDLALWWLLQHVHQQPRAVFSTALYASFQWFAWLTAHFAFRAGRANEELAAVNAHLLATRGLLAEGVRNGERLRLSRELHDVAGHALTGLKLHLELAQRLPDATARHHRLTAASELADRLLDDIHAVVGQLRRHDGVAVTDLLATACGGFPGIDVMLDLPPTLQLDDVDRADVLLRLVQEALTNAVRHGRARRVRVTLREADGTLDLYIEDNGHGCATPREGHGLTGMRERLAECDGQLFIDSAPGRGFRLHVRLPAQSVSQS